MMYRQFKCPYCNSLHKLNQCSVQCLNSNCPYGYCNRTGTINAKFLKKCMRTECSSRMVVTCPSERYAGDTPQKRYRNWMTNNYMDDNLKLDIPEQIADGSKTLTVAILGGTASGKSNYITAMIDRLNDMMSDFNCSIEAANDLTMALYEKYEAEIIEGKGLNEQTSANSYIPPLIYTLHFNDNKFTKRSLNLVFYDIAGEDLREGDKVIENHPFVKSSDLIIFMIDPVQIPAVRSQLEMNGASGLTSDFSSNLRDRPDRFMDRMITILSRGNSKIKIPIALCVPKIDIFKNHNVFEMDPGSPIFSESGYFKDGVFDEAEFKRTQIIMEDILSKCKLNNLMMLAKTRFSDQAFFGFSSFGNRAFQNIDSYKRVDPRDRDPYRVLDPIVWALSERGYFFTKKGPFYRGGI